MLTSKKGMSALQIMRFMGFGSYKTAWLMCHKIRTALVEDIQQLGGIVEVDETFVGGKKSNKHKSDRGDHTGTGNGPTSGKSVVVGAVQRKADAATQTYDRIAWIRYAAVWIPIPFVVLLLRHHLEAWHYYIAGALFIAVAAIIYTRDHAAVARRDEAIQTAERAQEAYEEARSMWAAAQARRP